MKSIFRVVAVVVAAMLGGWDAVDGRKNSPWALPPSRRTPLMKLGESSAPIVAFVSKLPPRGGQQRYHDYEHDYNNDNNSQDCGGGGLVGLYADEEDGQYDEDDGDDPTSYYHGRGGMPSRRSGSRVGNCGGGGGGDGDGDGDGDGNDDDDDDDGGGFIMPNFITMGNPKTGLPLLGIGWVLTILGISFFFDKTLMRLGNLVVVASVTITLGPGRTAGFLLLHRNSRATGCLVLGIALVFFGHPVIGVVLETFGLWTLFGNALAILKTTPVMVLT